ncbi:sensor histidine kinase [Streptomyces paludis]|uniref:Histidine kinase/HSP90-like ATPase domain-containing protein n=1 Tax=Streptomyces paludis TaxID=2282738 RepID=A0A345HK39_9ACTN|nr:ATP-binding protein [Streptomyces paludis]AXG77063.1 hypothetical protein DVK44_04500 [Streptomyces paludis]
MAHTDPNRGSAVHQEIDTSIRRALRRAGLEPAIRPEAVDELTVHACALFDEVIAVAETGGPLGMVTAGGAEWSQPDMDWALLLRAGTTLFEVVLPIALRELAPPDSAAASRVSALLHRGITALVVRGSLTEPPSPRELILSSRRDERRRMARELHDRVLHGIGLALHSLDLHRYHAESSPVLARDKVDSAIDQLCQAVHTLQQFSGELRRSVGPGDLEPALRSYLADHVEPSVEVAMRTRGNLASLPADIGEEVYLIVREAARNAVRHASPVQLDIAVEVNDRTIRATVTDDGCGTDADASRPGGGLSSMRERALLLRGQFVWTSAPGAGTLVAVRVPLGENRR